MGITFDAPLITGLPPLRTDIAITVFLADPGSYAGGELAIDADYGVQRFKGGAGDCIIYPSHMIHRVEQVGDGERIVSFFWIRA